MGIGGSVIFSTMKGKNEDIAKTDNDYFTISVIGSMILAVVIWISLILFEQPPVTAV